MEEPYTNNDISALRKDVDIYKTQSEIWAWCGFAIILILVCAVIYAFILIRRLRIKFEEKLETYQREARFTIDRPKLLLPTPPYEPAVTSSSRPQNDTSVTSSFNYKGAHRPQSLQIPSNGLVQPPNSPSPSVTISVPTSFDYKRAKKPTNLQLHPEGLQSPKSSSPSGHISAQLPLDYNGGQMPKSHPHGVQSPRSPIPQGNKPDNYKRVNENFLNKNRAIYQSPRGEDSTPGTPISPAYANYAVNNSPVNNNKFF